MLWCICGPHSTIAHMSSLVTFLVMAITVRQSPAWVLSIPLKVDQSPLSWHCLGRVRSPISHNAPNTCITSLLLGSGPYLSPAPRHRVVQIVFVVGELTDAIVDGHTAASRGQLLLSHLHPA